jgi:hypothetical protein
VFGNWARTIFLFCVSFWRRHSLRRPGLPALGELPV